MVNWKKTQQSSHLFEGYGTSGLIHLQGQYFFNLGSEGNMFLSVLTGCSWRPEMQYLKPIKTQVQTSFVVISPPWQLLRAQSINCPKYKELRQADTETEEYKMVELQNKVGRSTPSSTYVYLSIYLSPVCLYTQPDCLSPLVCQLHEFVSTPFSQKLPQSSHVYSSDNFCLENTSSSYPSSPLASFPVSSSFLVEEPGNEATSSLRKCCFYCASMCLTWLTGFLCKTSTTQWIWGRQFVQHLVSWGCYFCWGTYITVMYAQGPWPHFTCTVPGCIYIPSPPKQRSDHSVYSYTRIGNPKWLKRGQNLPFWVRS